MTLNAKNGKRNGYAYITKKVALNAYESDGFESLWEKVMALKAYENDGSEHLRKWWLRTHTKIVMALNTYENRGFESLWKWRL